MVTRLQTNNFDDNKEKIIRLKTKIYRATQHQQFLTECLRQDVCPKFTRFTKEQLSIVNWSPSKLHQERKERVKRALKLQEQNIQNFKLTLDNKIAMLTRSFPTESSVPNFLKICDRHVKISQKSHDINRDKKLQELISNKKQRFVPINIKNESDLEVPENILYILSKGANHSVGGKPNVYSMLSKFETFFQTWKKHATEKGLDFLTILEVKHRLDVEFHNLRSCFTKSDDLKVLNEYLNEHPEIRVCQEDKTKNLIILPTESYNAKLDNEFANSKFLKLNANPLYEDVKQYNKLLKTMKPFISKKTFNLIRPAYGLKRAYALIKTQKPGAPARPIISNIGAITSGFEKYATNILNKFRPTFKYEISGIKDFKTKFIRDRRGFDPLKHTLVSYDINKMFPSINLLRLIPKICDIIYQNPVAYFDSELLPNEEICQYPPREIF